MMVRNLLDVEIIFEKKHKRFANIRFDEDPDPNSTCILEVKKDTG